MSEYKKSNPLKREGPGKKNKIGEWEMKPRVIDERVKGSPLIRPNYNGKPPRDRTGKKTLWNRQNGL